MALWKTLVIVGFAINFLIPVLLWTSGDYEGKIIFIPQHVESEPTVLQPKDSIQLTYYVDAGKPLGLSATGTLDRISGDMLAAGKLDIKITNQNGQETGLEKMMVNKCNYPTTLGTSLGCFKVLESSNYTVSILNKAGFDLNITAMQFGLFDDELVTEMDDTMDEGDILPIFGYQIVVIISVIMIISGFVVKSYKK